MHAAYVAGASSPEQFPHLGMPEVALAGRSNVGKSALLNRLVGRHALARVSKTPGRTQQINFFVVDAEWVLVDLPGYGFARVPVAVQRRWRPLVEAYLLRRPLLRGVVLLIDVRRGIAAEDSLLLDTLRGHGLPVAVAVTKIDKLAWGQRQRQLAAIRAGQPDVTVIGCSAATGEGTQPVLAQLREWVTADAMRARSARH